MVAAKNSKGNKAILQKKHYFKLKPIGLLKNGISYYGYRKINPNMITHLDSSQ
jgi:hypothetical protein